jgi:vesicle coat complex subunit
MTIRYATEVDVDFVRKSVRAIGRCAVSIEAAAPRCVEALLELIKSKVSYVVQEGIVVVKVSVIEKTLHFLSFFFAVKEALFT